MVLGPAFPMNLLRSRMLANVPRAMTASLPRRDPYELNSRGVSLQHNVKTHHTASKHLIQRQKHIIQRPNTSHSPQTHHTAPKDIIHCPNKSYST